jgi:hypothetical protein
MPLWGLGLYRQWHRSQWPRGLRCVPTAARFLGLWFRILPAAWWPETVVSVLCCQVEVSATVRAWGNLPSVSVCHWVLSGSTVTLYTYNGEVEARIKIEKIKFLAQIIITQEKTLIFRVLLLIVLSRLGADHIFNFKSVPIVSLTKDYIISNTRQWEVPIQ